MMLEVLVEAALRTLLLAAVVKLGLWLFRIKRPQLVLIAWNIILLSSIAMPALQWATPLRLPVLLDLPSTTLIGASIPRLQSYALEAPGPALAIEIQEPSTITPWLEAVYLLMSSILLLRLTVGFALSLRLLSEATPIREDWAANADIRISRFVATPVTIVNVILLPEDAVEWHSTVRQAVLAHEKAHVVRWDFALLLISQVNRALFWFSPLSWWLHRRLAALVELVSDDHAMEVTGDRSGYAEVLLEMGRRSGLVLRGLAMARPATVRFRIERILSDRVRSDPVSSTQQLILAVSAAGLSIVIASSRFNSAPSSHATVPGEQQRASKPPLAIPSISARAAEEVDEPMLSPQGRTDMAFKALPHAGALPSDLPAAISRSHHVLRTAARPRSNPIAKSSITTQTSRATRPLILSSEGQIAVEALPGAKAVNSESMLSQTSVGPDSTNSRDGAADDRRQAPPARPVEYFPESERPVLRLINDRTCPGVYRPEHAASFVNDGLNLVRAKLFRDASGTSWLTFFLSRRTQVVQPVTVSQAEDKITASPDRVFTMVPRSARSLNGFIKRPYGTIDFDCGGSDAHLFDGGG